MINKRIWCKTHNSYHTEASIEQFTEHCKRLGLDTSNNKCPIYIGMEKNSQSLIAPDYVILPKPCTEPTLWPEDIDLVISKIPTMERDGYSTGLMAFLAHNIYYKLKNNSLVFLIASTYREDKARHCEIIKIFRDAKFNFVDTIIWHKNKFTPTQGGKRLNNIYDFILMFAKGDNYHLNRKSISYLRNDHLDEQDQNEHLCAGNVWRIKSKDKETIPDELIRCMVNISNVLPRSRLMDPFMCEATLRIALENDLCYHGFAPDKKEYDNYKKIILSSGKK